MNWGWKRVNEIVRFIGRSADPHAIKIGNEAENLAQTIKFELPHEFKYATAFLHIQFGYYADVVNLGDDRIFKPTRTHTQKPGRYTAYLEVLIDGDVVWKSDVFYLHVGSLPNDGELIEKKYPTAFEEALQAVAALTDLQVMAEELPAGSDPTVRVDKDENGKPVLVFGIPAGTDGFSPTITATAIDGGHRLTITGANGLQTVDIMDGADGAQGPAGPAGQPGANGFSPTITVAEITGGHQLTITDVNGTQTINVWDGKDGSGDGTGGGSGADGYSPTITVSAIEGGRRLTITDVNGSRTVDIMDGVDGAPGADGAQGPEGPQGETGPAGADGYTPQRGTDYWTAEDIAEIKAYVDDAILGGEW